MHYDDVGCDYLWTIKRNDMPLVHLCHPDHVGKDLWEKRNL